MRRIDLGPSEPERQETETKAAAEAPQPPFEVEYNVQYMHYLVACPQGVYRFEVEDLKGIYPPGMLWGAHASEIPRVVTYLWNTGKLKRIDDAPEPIRANPVPGRPNTWRF